MRLLKRILIILLVFWVGVVVWFVVLPYLGWGSEPAAEEVTESGVVTVQRGDLRIDITAVGNLELSLKENLSFDVAGYVEEVLVEEGEYVKEGQVLARVDTSEGTGQARTGTGRNRSLQRDTGSQSANGTTRKGPERNRKHRWNKKGFHQRHVDSRKRK